MTFHSQIGQHSNTMLIFHSTFHFISGPKQYSKLHKKAWQCWTQQNWLDTFGKFAFTIWNWFRKTLFNSCRSEKIALQWISTKGSLQGTYGRASCSTQQVPRGLIDWCGGNIPANACQKCTFWINWASYSCSKEQESQGRSSSSI